MDMESRRPSEGNVRWRKGIMKFSLEYHVVFTFKDTADAHSRSRSSKTGDRLYKRRCGKRSTR